MTNQQVIDICVANPRVIESHTRMVDGKPVAPTPTSLGALASTELRNEINSLLANPEIRKEVLERSESVSTATTTDEGRGAILELPTYMGSVISITTSDTQLPLTKVSGHEDFDYWYGERYKSASAPDSPEVWVPWSPSADGDQRILLAPGVGSGSTVKIAYCRRVDQNNLQIGILPDDVHFLVLTGVLNRLTGGAFEFSYNRDLTHVIGRLKRQVGGTSPMRGDPTVRFYNYTLAGMTGGWDSYGNAHDPRLERPY